jgi:hypothetical protein
MKEDEAHMMKNDAVRRSRGWAVALAVVLAIVHPGCGSDSTGPNNQTVTDTRTVPVLGFSFLAFTAQRNGTVDVDVNWGNAGNDIDIYATTGSCPDLDTLFNGGCQVFASSESATAKPERISFGVSNGSAYKVFAFNLGPSSDNVTITVTIH